MKTTPLLFVIILLGAALSPVQAQDFRSVPPAEQPNAAELAYFGGSHPDFPADNLLDSTNIRLVLHFLDNLKNGQFETAHKQLANGFIANGPGFADFLRANDLLQQWDRYGQTFTNQRFEIEKAMSTRVSDGDHQGMWVFVRGAWSGQCNRPGGMHIRIPFYTLVRLAGGLIERTYTSYGRDQIFYDLGFPLYTGPSGVAQSR